MRINLFNPFIFILLTAFFMASSCTPGTADDSKAADSVKSFYQSYIRENSKMPVDREKVAALQKQHCTAGFISKLAESELDADPFLNAQDVEEKWAENLEVTDSGNDLLNVCYTSSFDNAKHCAQVKTVNENGVWKIDNVAFQ